MTILGTIYNSNGDNISNVNIYSSGSIVYNIDNVTGSYAIPVNPNTNMDLTFTSIRYGSLIKHVSILNKSIKMDIVYNACAIFDNKTLNIPCVAYNNINYNVDLVLVNSPTSLSFKLASIVKPVQNTYNCAIYDGKQLTLPCVNTPILTLNNVILNYNNLTDTFHYE